MHFRIGAVVLIVVACSYAPSQSRKKHGWWDLAAQVEFYVGDPLKPAPKYRVTSFHKVGDDKEELAGRFHGLVLDVFEGGKYEYRLTPVGAEPHSTYELTGKLDLWGSTNWVTLQVPDDPVGPDFGEIDLPGRVIPCPRGKNPVWVRLQNVLRVPQVREAKVKPDGSFLIPAGLLTGNFVVTVCSGGDVLYLGVVQLDRTQPNHLEITLPTEKPGQNQMKS
jgi:hypothetical protein